MIFEGDKSVIDAIKEKKRLMAAGEEHGHIRPVLVVDGGLMKGSYGVGGCLALEELGYSDVFDSIVGVSSGAPTAAYFAAGNVHIGATILEDCCSRKFLNMWRLWNQVDTTFLMDILQHDKGRALSEERVLAAESGLYIGVAEYKDGTPNLIKLSAPGDLFPAIQATILMPNVSSDIVRINDIRYVDGGFTRPHILQLVLDEVAATHYLIITNQDHIGKIVPPLPWLERFLNHTLFRWRMPKALRFAAHERWKERMKVVKKIRDERHVPAALVWGDRSIKSMERDPQVVKQVVEKSRLWWLELLR